MARLDYAKPKPKPIIVATGVAFDSVGSVRIGGIAGGIAGGVAADTFDAELEELAHWDIF